MIMILLVVVVVCSPPSSSLGRKPEAMVEQEPKKDPVLRELFIGLDQDDDGHNK